VVSSTASPVTAQGSAKLFIPARTAQGTQRGTAFVSPSASSVGIAVNGGASTFADVSPTSSLCATVAGGRSCTVPFAPTIGSDTLVITLYAGANGTGSVLGTGSFTTTILANEAFTVAVTLGGVPARIIVSETATLTLGTPATVPLTVSVQDAGGNTIIGSGTYAAPLTLSDSDTSGSTTLSTTTVPSPSTTITLAYNGGAVPGSSVTISATAANVAATSASSATIAVTTASNACALHANVSPHLYVANDGSGNTLQFAPPIGSTIPAVLNSEGNPVAVKVAATGTLFVAPFGSSGSSSAGGDILEFQSPYTTPTATIGSGIFAGPRGIAIDGSLDLFVTDSGHDRVLEFTPPYTGTPAVLASGIASPYAIALSPNCNLFVTTNGTVVEYAPPYTGMPIATITASLSNPLGLAFDSSGNLFVSDATTNVVNEYAAPYTGSPLAQVALPAGASAFGIALDSTGNLYVSEYGLNAIAEYAAPYIAAPTVTTNGLSLPADVGVGP
jgi:streptogramin lyase